MLSRLSSTLKTRIATGWILLTSHVTLLDGATTLRTPGTRVTDSRGKDMEMQLRAVDMPVVRRVGEAYLGKGLAARRRGANVAGVASASSVS